MPTMARSMTQFGLLMNCSYFQCKLLWWGHARESMPQIEFIDPLSVETARLLARGLPFGRTLQPQQLFRWRGESDTINPLA
jgi:hypothetical protein